MAAPGVFRDTGAVFIWSGPTLYPLPCKADKSFANSSGQIMC